MVKFRKRKEFLAKVRPLDAKLTKMIITESVTQAADVGKEIGAIRPDFLALLFTGSNRVGLGDYRNPELDLRLITEGESWDILDMFRKGYTRRAKAQNLNQWREVIGRKTGNPYFIEPNEIVEPFIPEDLVLPPDTLDIGWNTENGALAAITSEGGAFTKPSLDRFVLEPNRLQLLKGRKGFNRGLLPIVNSYADLAAEQLAFSTPIWVKKGERDYINGLIKKARRFVLSISA